MTTRTLAALALCAGMAGCTTRNEINPATELPYDLRGTVVGRVTSAATGLPMAGATVSALAPGGAVTATSSADGTYELGGLPAGATYGLRFESAGCVTRLASASVPAAAGNVGLLNPVVTVDAVLARGDAAVAGTVLMGGAPAVGARLAVDLRASGLDLVVTAMTAADGGYRLEGLPGAAGGWPVTVSVAPFDADGDGVSDAPASSSTVMVYPASTTTHDLVLRNTGAGSTGLWVTSTDLGGGKHSADAPLHLAFSEPIDLVASAFTLSDQDGYAYRDVPVVAAADATGQNVAVQAVGGTPLASGHAYSLTVRAVAQAGDALNASYWFTATTGGGLLPPVTGLAANPARVDQNTTGLTLSWTALPAAASYEVYARDTRLNQSWVRIGSVGSAPAPSLAITLPSSFDYYGADGLLTPFAFGTQVELAVIAVGLTGASGDLAAAAPLRLGDTVAPTASWAVQRGSAVNPGAAPATLTLTVAFSEYMRAAAPPVIDLPAAGMSAAFELDAGLRQGTFTITVPAGTWGWGPYLIHGAEDSSGNPMTPFAGQLRQQSELVQNGGFETGGLDGWVAASTGAVPAPSATSAQAASGGWAASLGAAGVPTGAGSATLTQDFGVPAGTTDLVVGLRYLVTTVGSSYGYDSVACTLSASVGGLNATIFSTYYSYGTVGWTTPTTLHLSGWEGRTARLQCVVNEGSPTGITTLYLDDVTVMAIQ